MSYEIRLQKTIANQRTIPRHRSIVSSATPAINTNLVDVFGVTALATNITSFTTNLLGTPYTGQQLQIYIVGTATRTITWGASFESGTAALPSTTVGTTRLDVWFVWNSTTSKWRCIESSLGDTGVNTSNTARQSQVTVSATAYYITSSALTVPTNPKAGIVVGTKYLWRVGMDKTAAGTGTFQIIIYRGTNGSTSDTADVTQTIGTQTAVVDNMYIDVELVVTTAGATGGYYWSILPTNKAITATGFGVATGTGAYFSGTVASVALNTAALKFGLGFKATTGTPTITVPFVHGEAYNLV